MVLMLERHGRRASLSGGLIDSVLSNFCQITIDFINSVIMAGLSVGIKAPNTAALLLRRGTGFKLKLCWKR